MRLCVPVDGMGNQTQLWRSSWLKGSASHESAWCYDGHPLVPRWKKGKDCLVRGPFVPLLKLELVEQLRPYPHEQKVFTRIEDEMRHHENAEILAYG